MRHGVLEEELMQTINSFKELLNEVFYDWDYYSNNRFKKDNSGRGFSWNKTSLFYKNGEYILEYKMDKYKVDALVYKKFEVFYKTLENDNEFIKILDILEQEWFSWDKLHLVNKDNYIVINNIKVLENEASLDINEEIGFQSYNNVTIRVKKKLYSKILFLYKLLFESEA